VNHLAHLFLAEPTPPMMLGSLLADFVKGNAHLAYPTEVQAGIAQHRQVDAFTDAHPLVHRSIGRISRKWGWFSGIIIDVAYDHFLARNWSAFTETPLRQFTQHAYATLQQLEAFMPDTMQYLIRRMIAEDRLMAYSHLEGVEQTLGRISSRLRQRFQKREIRMERAVEDLREHHDDLERDFLGFFPELIQESRRLS
jgi:acyl carrier protein phosphodiesterase